MPNTNSGGHSAKSSGNNAQGGFQKDGSGRVVVYTDGSCLNNGQDGATAGRGVYFGPDNPMNVSEPVRGRATNNTAEIQAATRGLEQARAAGFNKVVIKTDSEFVSNCANKWMPNWKENGWTKADGSSVVNRSDLQAMDRAARGMDVRFEHVPGHAGNSGNEAADRLARDGASRYRGGD